MHRQAGGAGESDRIDFQLQLAGVRNVQAAPRAVLAGYNGDVDALKESESWLFTDPPVSKSQGGTTGLPNAGTSSDEGKTMGRWRKLAGVAFEGPCGEARTPSAMPSSAA